VSVPTIIKVPRPHQRADVLWRCGACGQADRPQQFHPGRGRHLQEHPDHLYCPCGASITWYGYQRVATDQGGD
jgi:hypothetical protein